MQENLDICKKSRTFAPFLRINIPKEARQQPTKTNDEDQEQQT
jgi:hypothetical protein